MPSPTWNPVGTEVLPQRKRAEAGEQTAWSEDPLGCTGKNNSPFFESIWERWHCLSGEKEPMGAIGQLLTSIRAEVGAESN